MRIPSHVLQQFVGDKRTRRNESKTTDLLAELGGALKAERFDHAIDVYDLMEKRKPDDPRWPHRKGDLLRRIGRSAEAVVAYERAVHLYSEKGFDARASATARLLVAIDPSKRDVLDWADSQAAGRLERQSRSAFQLNH